MHSQDDFGLASSAALPTALSVCDPAACFLISRSRPSRYARGRGTRRITNHSAILSSPFSDVLPCLAAVILVGMVGMSRRRAALFLS